MTNKLIRTELSKQELHLIQHLRMLGVGSHLVFLVKECKGRDGLSKFVVQKDLPLDNGK